MFSSSSPLSAHKDVLEAVIPDDPTQRATLLEELKGRGKGAVVAQRWPDAVALYQKALEVAVADNDKAILNANIALTQGKMGKWKESLDASKEAVRLDPTYLKGWWRLGQANTVEGNHAEAIAALGKALEIEPGNKALQKEIAKAKKAAEQAKDKKPIQPKVEKAEPLKKNSSTSKGTTSKVDTEPTPMEVDHETKFTASDHVKGYKVINGKKTSYFHNELSEDAAKLIGDIAPKKITETETVVAAPTNGASAWNKAGTWEEKDCTGWAKDALQNALLTTQAGQWKVTKAEIGSGHASVAMVRGKKRYIYEMEDVVLDWDFQDGDASGTIKVAGFDGTDDEYEFLEFVVSKTEDTALGDSLKRPSGHQDLKESVQKSIGSWVALFQETF